MMNRAFITGMGRSGTTLLDKLLSNHPDCDFLSQPFPLLFTEVKKSFLSARNITKYYVLNDSAFDGDYNLEEFNDFVASYKISDMELKNLLLKMEGYSGQMTKLSFTAPLREYYSFLEAFDFLIKSNLKVNKKIYFGSKEIMCEEFLPYLINNDTRIIVIVRDPRDVVASINYPSKIKYLGNKKPILFIVKAWRRAIKYAKEYENSGRVICVKYENLVTTPYKTLNEITHFLDVNPFMDNHFKNGIYDRDENLWQANTSFDTQTSFISRQSVGGYKDVLSDDEINYIEATCKYEMELMGYSLSSAASEEIIKSFKDIGVEESEHLDRNFSSLPENVEVELNRYEKYDY